MKKQRTIEVPLNWEAVKYKDYHRFIQSIEGQEDDSQLVTEMALQYLCNLNTADYYKLGKSTFNDITLQITELLMAQENQPIVKSFEVMGVEYRLEPQIEKMAYGMYLDLTTYSKDMWKNMPIICSILYRPVKNKFRDDYTLEPYTGTDDDNIQMFKDLLTMDICHGMANFFLSLQISLQKHSLTSSLRKVMKDLTIQQQEILLKSGVDIHHLLPLVEEISQKLNK